MPSDPDLRNLTSAVKDLTRSLRQAIKIMEALNTNIVEAERRVAGLGINGMDNLMPEPAQMLDPVKDTLCAHCFRGSCNPGDMKFNDKCKCCGRKHSTRIDKVKEII